MTGSPPSTKVRFDEARAATYDKHLSKVAPMVDALYLLTRLVLSDLPSQVHILCVGAGTGAELINLSKGFPHWQFTAVEPAPAMLAICRQKAEAHGITDRCNFHEGYLDSLPLAKAYDAATCFMVSQFHLDTVERSRFFHQIASRLHPEGILVCSDLCADMGDSLYPELLELQNRLLRHAEYPAEQIAQFCGAYGRDVAVLPAVQIEEIIRAGGFKAPVQFFQSIMIRAWYAGRLPPEQIQGN